MIARLLIALSILALGGCFTHPEPSPSPAIQAAELVRSYNRHVAPAYVFETIEGERERVRLRNLFNDGTDTVRVFQGQAGLILEIEAGMQFVYGYVTFRDSGPVVWVYETEYARANPRVVSELHALMRRQGVQHFGRPDRAPGSVVVNDIPTIEAGYRFLLTQPGFEPYNPLER